MNCSINGVYVKYRPICLFIIHLFISFRPNIGMNLSAEFVQSNEQQR